MSEMTLDRTFFSKKFPRDALFDAKLTPARLEGFNAIFDIWDSRETYDALEWLAYALATAWHETGARMQPVREGFAASDQAAYDAVTAYCKKNKISNYAARHTNGNSYYGRGYVQLTHGENYKKMGKHLGIGDQLYNSPDEVLDPGLGGRILLVGMMDGLFRPSAGRLSDYFSGSTQRWFEARDLINGDKNKVAKWAKKKIGTLVADYGKGFVTALRYQ
jgi:hypothetical protein